MNKLLLISVCLTIFISAEAKAFAIADFSYDRIVVEQQVAQLTLLENYLAENPEATLSQVLTEGNYLVHGWSSSSDLGGVSLLSGKISGIPSYMWGCCLGWVGVLYVALEGKDNNETRLALYGALTTLGGLALSVGAAYLYLYYISSTL